MKQIIKNILFAGIAIILISMVQGLIFGMFNEGNGGWWFRFSNDAPIALGFNIFSAIVYFLLFEIRPSKLSMLIKAIIVTLICSGSYFVLATCFTYMGVAFSVKFLVIMLCLASGNMLYPFIKKKVALFVKN